MRKVIVSYLLCRYLIFFFFTRQKMSSDNVVDFKTEFKGLEKLKTIEIQLAVERAHRVAGHVSGSPLCRSLGVPKSP